LGSEDKPIIKRFVLIYFFQHHYFYSQFIFKIECKSLNNKGQNIFFKSFKKFPH